ncbi:MAG: sigma-54-dependent Fis family transcriptional regulator [Proteobacteria bacterium]|nr:sigma-54-dependent Fis family transcriptional regulator [Pseudomonadota bacterium]
MINWEELKHIHVIRKLQQIIGQWFHAEVFFLDERGVVRNYDPYDRQREFKNPLCGNLLPKEPGRELVLNFFRELSDRFSQQHDPHWISEGPLGFEKFFAAKVHLDGEYLGAVVAYCHLDREIPAQALESAVAKIEAAKMDVEFFREAVGKIKPLTGAEAKYFYELVDLVAQEITAFHTEISKREARIHALSNQLENRYSYNQMIGKSKPMQELYSILDKVSSSEATVLIQGENGTGKELIARSVHFNSPRKTSNFVTVNCSALTETLLDSELFGHVKGSFTGAIKDKKGLFEMAHNGTLFLDEVGDMSLAMQVKLLRVLQQGTLTPVGGTEERKVDVRVIAATNRDLKRMIEDGTFREDLYYRINVINIQVPSLRDRKEDIPVLVDHFLLKNCKEKEIPLKALTSRAMEKIFDYHWPGNIRQLENEVERLVVLSGTETKVGPELLSQPIRDAVAGSGGGTGGKGMNLKFAGKLRDAMEELEKTMIKEGLRRTKWNKSKLAKELGISRAGLIMKVEKYGLDKRKGMRDGEGGPQGGGEAA